MSDFYQVLGMPRNASQGEIKQAYRKLARQYHPDVNPDKAGGEERFKEINGAYEVLSNPEYRRRYDKYGDNWKHSDQIEEAQGEEEERQREEEDDGLHQGVHQPEHEGHEEHIQVPPRQVDAVDEVGRPGQGEGVDDEADREVSHPSSPEVGTRGSSHR